LALRARRAGEGHARPIALWIFLAVLFVLQLWNNFGPPPGSVTELALMALASFLFLPVGAALVEWTASSRAAGQQKAAAVLPVAAFRKRHETSLASQRPCKRGYLDDALRAFFNALSRFALHER
jgi:hypothetical protein